MGNRTDGQQYKRTNQPSIHKKNSPWQSWMGVEEAPASKSCNSTKRERERENTQRERERERELITIYRAEETIMEYMPKTSQLG